MRPEGGYPHCCSKAKGRLRKWLRGVAMERPEEDAALVADLEWVHRRRSATTEGLIYTSVRGTPTMFHLRSTCVLLARPLGNEQYALVFAAQTDSLVVRALAAMHTTFDAGVTAIFEKHAKVFDSRGEGISDMCASDLQGWVGHALINLRGRWESKCHTGLRLEVSQMQLVQPPG